jgi:hypothetical protein
MTRGLQPPIQTYHVIYDVANDNDCFVKVNSVFLLSSTLHPTCLRKSPHTTCVLAHTDLHADLQIKFGVSYIHLLSMFE